MTTVKRRAVDWPEFESMLLKLAQQVNAAKVDYHLIINLDCAGQKIPQVLLEELLVAEQIRTVKCVRDLSDPAKTRPFPKIPNFPAPDLLYEKRIMIMSAGWVSGHAIIGARQLSDREEAIRTDTAVLHFQPGSENLFARSSDLSGRRNHGSDLLPVGTVRTS